jgi:hypothetical protein
VPRTAFADSPAATVPHPSLQFREAYEIIYFVKKGSLASFFPVVDHDQPGFPAQLLTLRPYGDPAIQAALDPELASVSTIEASLYDLPDTAKWADARVAVLTEFYGAENYGHRIGDAAFSVFLIQETFGLLSRDTQFIAYRSCLQNCLSNRFCASVAHERRWEWCENDLPDIMAGLSHRPLQFLESTLPLNSLESEPLCFENLLLGMGQFTFRRMNIGMSSVWRAFRDFFIAGIPATRTHDQDTRDAPPDRRSMVVLDRTGLGRHNWLNAQACAARLREEFETWDVHVLDLRQRPSLAYMHIIHGAHVLVTPGGGFAFASVFLPNSACAVYIDTWRDQETPPRSTRHHNESTLWDSLGYIRATYYRRFAHEPGEVLSRKANFTVDPQRLLTHVAVCIRHVLPM